MSILELEIRQEAVAENAAASFFMMCLRSQSSFFLLILGLLAAAGLAREVKSIGPYGGDVRSLAVHPARPGRFFLGTSDGQVYVSADAGLNWKRSRPGLNVRDVVVDNLVFHPADPDILYAGCWSLKSDRGWLFRTRDGGSSWQEIPLGEYGSQVRALAVAPSDSSVLALGVTEGVILSTDEGATWERITRGYRSLHNVESLAFDPSDAMVLYVGTWRLGWKTLDRGKKWVPIHEGMAFDSDMFSLLVDPDSPEVLYASACTGVYRSRNAGQSWVKLKGGLPEEARRTRTLHLSPVDPSTVYAGTTIGVFVTNDSGLTWRRLVGDVTVNAVAVDPSNPETILVGADDVGVLRSSDSGSTFSPSNQGFVHRQVAALAVQPGNASTLYAAIASDGAHGGLFVSRDSGAKWVSSNEGLDSLPWVTRILASRSTEQVFLATVEGVFMGVPGSRPWKLFPATRRLRVLDIAFAGTGESVLALATPEGLYRLNLDHGNCGRWEIPVYDGKVNGVFFDNPTNSLFASTEIGVFVSDQGIQPWEIRVGGLPPVRVNRMVRSGQRLVCGTSQGVFLSEDNARNWVRPRQGPLLEIVDVEANPLNPEELYAVDSTGFLLFQSLDGGVSWSEVSLGQRSRISQLVFAVSGDLLAGTLSEGIYLVSEPESGATGR